MDFPEELKHASEYPFGYSDLVIAATRAGCVVNQDLWVVNIEYGLPGYEECSLRTEDEAQAMEGWTAEEWLVDYRETGHKLRTFLSIRDPYIVLAKTAVRHMMETMMSKPQAGASAPNLAFAHLEQSEVELVQALLLMLVRPTSGAPTSPGSFLRFWPLVKRYMRAFVNKQSDSKVSSHVSGVVTRTARLQTLYYRNLFTRADCEQTLTALLQRFDGIAARELGYPLSELFRALVRLADIVFERLKVFTSKVAKLMTTTKRQEVIEVIEFFRSAYPVAAKAWRNGYDRFPDVEELRIAGYQVSELANPWVCSVPRAVLEDEFTAVIVQAIDRLSLRPGALAEMNPEHIHLQNPIWQKPYIKREDGSLFIALPQLIFSFPFAIIEGVMAGHESVEKAYEKARGDYLEDAVTLVVRRAMPSAEVYRSVLWDDLSAKKTWENDIVAVVGNFIFLFEAKSGRIADAARRGGIVSLERNFRELFVEPGEQAWRLQNYLDIHKQDAKLRLKSDGSEIDLKLDRPKIVFKFSICIEHFTALTSARHYFKELGLLTADTAWAPVISLAELLVIESYLDNEVSFIHYLSRRTALEDQFDFYADEHDILSLYLTNGFWLDADALKGRKVMFSNADWLVRRPKVPRRDRTIVDLPGINLSPMWFKMVKELYSDNWQRHRFDIINVILNQPPAGLAEVERRVRRWRRGVPHHGEDVAVARYNVGDRLFLLAVHLTNLFPTTEDFHETARSIALNFLQENATVNCADCAVFFFARRSKAATFDGVSFFRFGPWLKRDAKEQENTNQPC